MERLVSNGIEADGPAHASDDPNVMYRNSWRLFTTYMFTHESTDDKYSIKTLFGRSELAAIQYAFRQYTEWQYIAFTKYPALAVWRNALSNTSVYQLAQFEIGWDDLLRIRSVWTKSKR